MMSTETSMTGLRVTPEMLETFLERQRARSRNPGSIRLYQQNLWMLYDSLGSDKTIHSHTLENWRDDLIASGYAARTVNTCISVANSFLQSYHRRDLQLATLKLPEDPEQPELSREEYLRLLSAAKALSRERTYLLVKVFGSTGLAVRDLPCLTVEAVEAGRIDLPGQEIELPECLRAELADYIVRNRLTTGPVFVTRKGTPMSRNCVTGVIRGLCEEARVPAEKGSPRCLRRLYQTTQENIYSDVSILVRQAYDQMLAGEQSSIGWNEATA